MKQLAPYSDPGITFASLVLMPEEENHKLRLCFLTVAPFYFGLFLALCLICPRRHENFLIFSFLGFTWEFFPPSQMKNIVQAWAKEQGALKGETA